MPPGAPRNCLLAVLSSGGGVCFVKVGCPTTERAACPVVKSAADTALAAAINIRAQYFMFVRLGQVTFQYIKDTDVPENTWVAQKLRCDVEGTRVSCRPYEGSRSLRAGDL